MLRDLIVTMEQQTHEQAMDRSNSLNQIMLDANSGDSSAQGLLATRYFWGIGLPQSSDKAAEWAEKAGSQGDSNGQMILGHLHAEGAIYPRDWVKGFDLLKRAADQGNLSAANAVGQAYACGKGVERNRALAEEWLLAAAGSGHARSMTNLGMLYLTRSFTRKRSASSRMKAYLWLSAGIRSGETARRACFARWVAGLLTTREQANIVRTFLKKHEPSD